MNPAEALPVAIVLVGMLLVMVRGWAAPAMAILGALIVFLVLGVLTVEEAFAGFANPAPITVAALFIVAKAVERTGVLQPAIRWALTGNTSIRYQLGRLAVPAAGASAFLNNTPIVAVLTTHVSSWARREGRSVGVFLMPISFAAILGGTLTLVGTSTNLVVSGLLESYGEAPIGMFELTPLALPGVVVALGVVLVLAPKILVERRGPAATFEAGSKDFVVEMEVLDSGPAAGQTVSDIGLRHLTGVFLARIDRGRSTIAPVPPNQVLHAGDCLQFVGRVDQVLDLQAIPGIRFSEHKFAQSFEDRNHCFFEAVMGPASPLVGQTLKTSSFREQYQAAVLAIHRAGRRVDEKLGNVTLQAGDTLLLLADPDFGVRWRDRMDFLLIAGIDGTLAPPTWKAATAVGTLVGVVGLAALGLLPILHGALLGALLLVVTKTLTPNEARNAVNLEVILVIAGSLGLGTALQVSGLAGGIAESIVNLTAGLGPLALLAGILMATLLLTELVTNNAAAALMFPIAMAAAHATGAEPRQFALVLAIVASASFLSPIGYQTNTMVMGPGGYRFGDYARLGLPVTLVFMTFVLLTARWIGV